MGEVAEMMLDGTLCQKCGGFAGEPVGFPRDCEDCRREHNRERGIAGANQVGKKRLARLRIVAERGGCSVGDAMAQIESLRRSGYVAVEGGVATITEAGRACLAAHARRRLGGLKGAETRKRNLQGAVASKAVPHELSAQPRSES